jgi:hypothetical protein
MTDFTYTAGSRSGVFSVDEEYDLGRMTVEAETKLLSDLAKQGLAILPEEKTYLRSRIALTITRDIVSRDTVDLGEIKVQGGVGEKSLPLPVGKPDASKLPPPPVGGTEYTLIYVNDNHTLIKRAYNPEQPVGAIAADLRKLYDLKPSEQVHLFQSIGEVQQEISPTARLKNLSVREIYWDIQKI